MNPGSVSSAERAPPPIVRSASKTITFLPARARTMAAARPTAPPPLLTYLWRWTLFRVMFGAGLIKVRGDSCWRDLTCLDYYFETQPIPNPASWYFHWMPWWVHQSGVVANHIAELI